MKKLTEPQLEKLFAFTKKHYVDYYDLQLELVDHLSNGIEVQWQEHSKLSFEDALRKEFKKFGIFGFTDLVDERKAKMGKRYNKLILIILKTYITLPKVIVSLMLFLAMYLVLSFAPYKNYAVIFLFVVPYLIMFYKTIAYRIQRKKAIKAKNKIWMFEEIITSYGDKFFLFQILIQFHPLIDKMFLLNVLSSSLGLFVVSFILVLFLLVVYIMVCVIPSKAKAHIMAAHPEYGLV